MSTRNNTQAEASEEKCENCRFWDVGDGFGDDADRRHRCKKRSPSLILYQCDPDNTEASQGDHAVWPITPGKEWCGEWQEKRTPLPVVQILDQSISSIVGRRAARGANEVIGKRRNMQRPRDYPGSVSELIQLTADELLDAKNFGTSSLHEIRVVLACHGLKLKGDA